MITLSKLKLNNFEEVTIPKPKELFARFGYTSKSGGMSGDLHLKTNQSKVEAVAEVEKEILEKED